MKGMVNATREPCEPIHDGPNFCLFNSLNQCTLVPTYYWTIRGRIVSIRLHLYEKRHGALEMQLKYYNALKVHCTIQFSPADNANNDLFKYSNGAKLFVPSG